jgi:CyaY protein
VAAEPPSAEAWVELAEAVLDHVEDVLDRVAPEDVEYDRTGDVLTIEFEDGVRYVLSINRDRQRLYVSADGAGDTFTYQPDDRDWLADDGRELYTWFGARFADRSGIELDL